ncbi:MAG: sulfonate transporter ATP-binding protein [Frankiales bacterium]|nr:sulfonate transporter ATP-binding protein [Frankiales bacterium]
MRVTGLSLSYGSHVVLDDVTVEVAPGELVVLTGEDGCGTSSLLRLLPGALLETPPGSEWAPSDVVPASPALAALGADHLVGRTLEVMSNGERQRVRLASVMDEPVLLLDDGLGYLDLAGVHRLLLLLRARTDAGAAVLLVAKGEERAFAAADRVLLLEAGRLAPVTS